MRPSYRAAVISLLTGLGSIEAQQPARPQRPDTIVRIAAAPVHKGIATLIPEISIGVVDGAPEYMFGEIADIAVARDGKIVVLDRKVPAIRTYDANGKYIATLGGRGSGPGEYRALSGVNVLPDGRVLIFDTGNWRINVYEPTGRYRTLWPTPSAMGGSGISSAARALVAAPTGEVFARQRKLDRATMTSSSFWVKMRSDGTPVDTLPEPVFGDDNNGLVATRPGGQSESRSRMPFAPLPIVAFSPLGYFVTGYGDRYAFEIVRPGEPVISIRRPDAKPYPVSRHERDSARAVITERMQTVDPAWTWPRGRDISPTKPFFDALTVAADGRIWVPLIRETLPRMGTISNGRLSAGSRPPPRSETPRELSDAVKPALYDVFEPTGVYVGQVQLPPRMVMGVARGDYVWGVAFDDDDVAFVKRYRIGWK